MGWEDGFADAPPGVEGAPRRFFSSLTFVRPEIDRLILADGTRPSAVTEATDLSRRPQA